MKKIFTVQEEIESKFRQQVQNDNKVISIVVKYSGADTNSWTYKPDLELESPTDLLKIIKNYR